MAITLQLLNDLTASVLTMSGPQLVEAYNSLAPSANKTTIKKFKDKAAGAAKLMILLEELRASLPKDEPKTKAPRAKKSTTAKPRTASVSGAIQQLVIDGKTNEEIWAIVQPMFQLDDAKKYYCSWNRSHLKRQGKI